MTILGTSRSTRKPVTLASAARRLNTYLIGTTGSGKSTLLSNIAYQDMQDVQRPGLCVIDPHGALVDDILAVVPSHRKDDVIVFAPGNTDQFDQPLGLNILACDRNDPRQVRRVVSTVIDTLFKLFSYSWGPRMEDLLRVSILTLMETPQTTLLDLLLLLASPDHRAKYTAHLENPTLRHYWDVQFAIYTTNMRMLAEIVGSSLNKIGRFVTDPLIRNVVAQPQSAFSMSDIMENGQILLVDLSKGDLGEDNSALLGSVLVNLILIAGLQRKNRPGKSRRPFHCIIDECQSVATESLPTLMSEGRKYGIDVIAAHQYRDQLDDLQKGAMLNAANFLMMRVTGRDGLELASQFDNTPPLPEKKLQPLYRRYEGMAAAQENLFIASRAPEGEGSVFREVDEPRRLYSDVAAEMANKLSIQPNYRAYGRLIEPTADGETKLTEYEIQTLRQMGQPDANVAAHIRARSLALGVPRAEVEAMIKAKVGSFDMDIPAFDLIPPDEE